MRYVLVLIEAAAVLAAAYLLIIGVVAATGRRRTGLGSGARQPLPAGGRWQPRHFESEGDTVVTVARMTPKGEVLEEHVVARIPDSGTDWSRRFLAAKQEAEERAFHLNGDL